MEFKQEEPSANAASAVAPRAVGMLMPALFVLLATVLFAIGMLAGMWQVGYWTPIVKTDAAGQKTSEIRAHAQLERLRRLLLELDTRGQETKKRSDSLDEREAKVRKTEADLELQKAALEQLSSQIVIMRKNLDSHLIIVDQAQEAGLQQMSKVYSAMSPVNAAKVLAQLPDSQTVQIMSKMKLGTAVKILEVWLAQDETAVKRATRITELMRVVMRPPVENTP